MISCVVLNLAKAKLGIFKKLSVSVSFCLAFFPESAEKPSFVRPTEMQLLQRRRPWFYSVMLFASLSATQHSTASNCPDQPQNPNTI